MNTVKSYLKTYTKLGGLLILLAASFVYAMFQGGFVSWFLFYSFLPFALYSICLFFYSLQQFTVTREMSKKECQAGDKVDMLITIERKFPFPLFYMVVEEQLPPRLSIQHTEVKKVLLFPWFQKKVQVPYTVGGLPRGEHVFQEIILRTGDLIGLFEKETSFEPRNVLMVLPHFHELAYRQIENVYDQGFMGSTPKLQRENSLVAGIREYQPGDQLSWINWKATARKNEIMTKEFEERKSQDLFLILDERESANFEEKITFMASFVHTTIKKGIQLGYGSTGTQEILPIRGGSAHKQKIFHLLTKSEAAGDQPLRYTLHNYRSIIPLNAALVIVTSNIDRMVADDICSIQTNQPITVFSIKKTASLTADEVNARNSALIRGITIKYVEKGHIEDSVAEVMA